MDGGPWQEHSLTGTGVFRVPLVDGLADGAHRLKLRSTGPDLVLLGLSAESLPGPVTARLVERFGAVTVTWTPPASTPVVAYEVLRWAATDPERSVVTTTTAFSHVDENPTPGTAVHYGVRGVLANGQRTGLTPAGRVAVAAHPDWIRVSGVRGSVRVERAGQGKAPPRLAWSPAAGPVPDTGIPLGLWASDAGNEPGNDAGTGPVVETLALGDPLRPGDRLLVDEGGWLEVELAGAQFIRLDQNTTAAITGHDVDPVTGRQATSLRLTPGRIWVNLRQQVRPDSSFTIETETVVITTEQTIAAIDVAANRHVDVWSLLGEVQVQPPDGAAGIGHDDTSGEGFTRSPDWWAAVAAGEPVRRYRLDPAALPTFVQAEAVKLAGELAPDVWERLALQISDTVFEQVLAEAVQEAEQRLRLEHQVLQDLRATAAEAVAGALSELGLTAQTQVEAHQAATAEAMQAELERRLAEVQAEMDTWQEQVSQQRQEAIQKERERQEELKRLQREAADNTVVTIQLSFNPNPTRVGQLTTTTAVALNADGQVVSGVKFTFSTEGPYALIDSFGKFLAIEEGWYTVYAIAGGVTGSADIYVEPFPGEVIIID